jgi:DNA repair exonuclease SbcCD ATPase subunit
MAADYAALEARVAELEQQIRHMLPAKVDVVSLVHEDTRYLREQSDIHGAALQRLETRLDRHSDLLHQQSDRLQGLETRLDRHSDQLHQQSDRLQGLETRLDRHGDLLQEILRRLPPGPPTS